jgi:hypothetical protein
MAARLDPRAPAGGMSRGLRIPRRKARRRAGRIRLSRTVAPPRRNTLPTPRAARHRSTPRPSALRLSYRPRFHAAGGDRHFFPQPRSQLRSLLAFARIRHSCELRFVLRKTGPPKGRSPGAATPGLLASRLGRRPNALPSIAHRAPPVQSNRVGAHEYKLSPLRVRTVREGGRHLHPLRPRQSLLLARVLRGRSPSIHAEGRL